MTRQVLFFHGGGSEEDYDADAKLVHSLKACLGSGYSVKYPFLPNDGTPDLGRRKQISHAISDSEDNVILAAHSFGASMLLICLSEENIRRKIAGAFLISTPFWQGDEEWVEAFKLKHDFAAKLDKTMPLYFYHCRDDEEVSIDQMLIYKKKLPWAAFREIPVGGHQLDNDLTLVANDIKSL